MQRWVLQKSPYRVDDTLKKKFIFYIILLSFFVVAFANKFIFFSIFLFPLKFYILVKNISLPLNPLSPEAMTLVWMFRYPKSHFDVLSFVRFWSHPKLMSLLILFSLLETFPFLRIFFLNCYFNFWVNMRCQKFPFSLLKDTGFKLLLASTFQGGWVTFNFDSKNIETLKLPGGGGGGSNSDSHTFKLLWKKSFKPIPWNCVEISFSPFDYKNGN